MDDLTPGKRYRVTRTGTAKNSRYVRTDAGAIVDSTLLGTTVELLPDPLPTTPGSVADVTL